jgi:hypothetical protein
MSLICEEHGHDIEHGDPLYCGTRDDVSFYSAFCQSVIDSIPTTLRRVTACPLDEDGVDIHEGSAGRNFNGSYSLFSFDCGKFLFSISQEAAEQYLPIHTKRYAKKAARTAREPTP